MVSEGAGSLKVSGTVEDPDLIELPDALVHTGLLGHQFLAVRIVVVITHPLSVPAVALYVLFLLLRVNLQL
jgi:hypothetical protein